jgi:hypothetical protein
MPDAATATHACQQRTTVWQPGETARASPANAHRAIGRRCRRVTRLTHCAKAAAGYVG